MIEVTVAIPTFKRNEHLVELLPLLIDQAGQAAANGPYNVRLLVIDNDPEGGARQTVWEAGGEAVQCVSEPTPGLSAVRNRAIAEAEGSRLLAFMDDDGRPCTGWLVGLLHTWADTGAAAIAGRVLEEYEVAPDPWIEAGGFFRRRSMPTLSTVAAAPAGNLLIDLEVVRRLGLRFDARLGLAGGEDTLFTRQLTAAGERIVWCDESRVVDLVPAARMNRRWVLKRAYSHGNTTSLVAVTLASRGLPRLGVRVACVGGGLGRGIGGVSLFIVGKVTGNLVQEARGLRAAHRGLGMVSGSFGHRVEEYAR